MENMSDADLVDFRNRCVMAAQRGYLVARADEYLEALEAEAGSVEPPAGTEPGSAAHLSEMASAALEARAGGGGKKKHKRHEPPKPEKSAPKAAPAKTHKSEAKEDPVAEIEVQASYDTWTHDELYAEAQAREIPNRSKMTKEELVAVLEASDEESAK